MSVDVTVRERLMSQLGGVLNSRGVALDGGEGFEKKRG